jgi:predicted dehydrogenase
VTRCSGDLLGEAPVILYRDGQTRRFHDLQTGWETSFIRGAHEFCDAVVAGTQPQMEATEARHALAFCLAAMRSAIERREVELSEL